MSQREDSVKRNRFARELHRFLRRSAAIASDPAASWPDFCQGVQAALKKLEQTETAALYSPYYTEMLRLAESVRLRAAAPEGDMAEMSVWLPREMNRLEKMRRVGSYQRSGHKRYENEEWE
ncbi:MAG: hypothetical protein AB7E49_11370 [Campylobacterales bacterium]